MRVLCACEESQAVTIELRRLGHDAYSNDIMPCRGGHPEWHIQADARDVVKDSWDMCIAFPPCTHLASSGARWFEEKRRLGIQQEAIDFFLLFTKLSHVPRVCIENPVGIMSTVYRKPDQIIQPCQFGDPFEKRTCLWLKGLPKLVPTEIVKPEKRVAFASGKSMPAWYASAWKLPPEARARLRSKTFPGIARAMAEQWAHSF